MKKYAIPVVVILAVIAVTWSAFAQAQDRPQRGSGRGGGTRRSRMTTQDQQKAIKAIEEQLVKVKAAAQVQIPQGGFADLSEEERTKIMTAYRDRSTALQAIVAQVALLQGRTQPTEEGARFIIINTTDLKPIQEAATKEKAEETGKLLERLMARGSGRGGGRTGGGQRGQRQQ